MKKLYEHIPRTVGVIGGKGQMGRVFARALRAHGVVVHSADVDATDVVRARAVHSDIVIVTVPIRVTEQVIADIAPQMRHGALLVDLTSVKVMPMRVMRRAVASGVGYMGMHPLFGPSTPWAGQNVVVCPGRASHFDAWGHNFLVSAGVRILTMDADAHDRHMAVIQCLTHFSNITLGSALQKLHYDIATAEHIATPVYKMRLYTAGRILAQDAELYADIQTYNPYAAAATKTYIAAAQELHASITRGGAGGFGAIFLRAQKHFGAFAKKSLRVTDAMIAVITKKSSHTDAK